MTISKTARIVTLATIVFAALAAPAFAKVYNVVFAGEVVPVNCDESPEGHTLTWVNQNCTCAMVAPAGTGTIAEQRDGAMKLVAARQFVPAGRV